MKTEKIPCAHCGGKGHTVGFTGAAIRRARVAAELSLREVALDIGCSAAFLSDVELGRRNPNEKIIKFIQSL